MDNKGIALKRILLHNIKASKNITSKSISFSEMHRSTIIEVLNFKGKSFEIKIKDSYVFVPEKPMDIEIEAVGYFSISSDVTKEQLEEKKKDISEPILHYISFVFAFIFEKIMGGPPLIIPPYIDEDEDDEDEGEHDDIKTAE